MLKFVFVFFSVCVKSSKLMLHLMKMTAIILSSLRSFAVSLPGRRLLRRVSSLGLSLLILSSRFQGRSYLTKAQASLQGAIDSLLRGWWGGAGTAKEKESVDSRLPSLLTSDGPSSPTPPPRPGWGDGGARVRRRAPGVGSCTWWSGHA